MIGATFKDVGISLPRNAKQTGNLKVVCPQCVASGRDKPGEPSINVTFGKTDAKSGAICHPFFCHRCSLKGAVFPDGTPDESDYTIQLDTKSVEYKKPSINLDDFDLTDEVIEWFAKRGIDEETVASMGIKACDYVFEKGYGKEPAIMFPSFKNGVLINIQYRNLRSGKEKHYRSSKDCQLIYYGFDDVVVGGYLVADTLIICEGHIDKVTLRKCGYPFCWSVPNGTPFPAPGKPELINPKLEFQNDPDSQEVLRRVKKVVFAGDDDHQGRQLVRELATRIGIEKCYRVKYPDGCKDINEVYVKYGADKVIECIERAERFPVEGVVRITQLIPEIQTLYTNGIDTGLSTGFDNMDPIFRVGRGKVILVTGVPMSGKSRFLLNMLILMAKLHGIKFSMFSPESRPFGSYTAKAAQILTGKRFGVPGDDDRMSQEELDEALKWMAEYFTYNSPKERTLNSIKQIWKQQLEVEGTRYGVIDPFNYIVRPGQVDEHQFVLQFMTELEDYCADNDFTTFVVAHPTKVHLLKSRDPEKDGEYPVIQPYNISGSSHWYNCTDFILSIWRSVKDPTKPVQLHVLKAKQEELGVSNEYAEFHYDVATGIYTPYEYDPSDEEEDVPFNEHEDEPAPVNRRAASSRN